MATIVLRSVKGTELDHAEVDANFSNLNSDKVETSRTISAGLGLSGGGDLTANRTLQLSLEALESLGRADTAVQPARLVSAGTGLAGGGSLATDRTLSLSSAAQASLALADSAVQPAGLAPYAPLNSPTLTGNPAAPTPAALDNDTSIATTAFVQSAVAQSGPLAGFRNAIINGDFRVAQRGITFNSAGNVYTLDRWKLSGIGDNTVNLTRQAFTLGQTDVPGEPEYFLRIVNTAGTTSVFSLEQPIEGVRTFAGQQVTFRAWMRSTLANPFNNVIRLDQQFGTGGSPTGPVTGAVSYDPPNLVENVWTPVTFTGTLPSVSDKILGSDVNDSLLLYLRLRGSSSYTLDIANVQLEPGPVATTFERRPDGVERALCERYHQRLSELSYNGAANSSANTLMTWQFRQVMRAVPTISYSILSASSVSDFPATDRCVFAATSSSTNQCKLGTLIATAEL